MSRPANPYDNASCESFIKTLKREEIYANRYEDLGHMRVNIAEFIEQYYNRLRLHSAFRLPFSGRIRRAGRSFDRGQKDRERNPGVLWELKVLGAEISLEGATSPPSQD